MSGFFSDRDETIRAEPLLTDEQKQSMSLLTNFGRTGSIGNFQAGAPADLSGFNFGETPLESLAKNRIFGLIEGPKEREGISQARDTFGDFVDAEFDIDDPSTGLSAFRRQLSRSIKDSDDVLDREAAATGSRFSSRLAGAKTDLAERQSDILGRETARQFERGEQRRFQSAGALADLDRLQEQIESSRIAQAFQIGGLQRTLKNQEAQLKLNDFLRQRNERLGSIGALETVFGRSVPFGLKETTIERPSVFQSMLGEISPIVGSYNTQRYGGNVPNQASISDLAEIAKTIATQGGA